MNSNLSAFFIFLFLATCALQLDAQRSSIIIRNSSWNDWRVSAYQEPVFAPDIYTIEETTLLSWHPDTEILSIDRNNAAFPGQEIIAHLVLTTTIDTVRFMIKLTGTASGSVLEFGGAVNSEVQTLTSDTLFHTTSGQVKEKALQLKYKASSDVNFDKEIVVALHDQPVYELDAADFENPAVINVMAYNIQMLPFGVSGMQQASERGALFPAMISPHQDVVIMEEVFDDDPRTLHLMPAMENEGFIYRTEILNNYAPFNGGVMIFSRWPIVDTAMYDFELCGQGAADCFANKGINYAAVNKLGNTYHVFGTHMDAGSGADDIEAKNLQMAEMRDFIAAQQIPSHEAVVFGGDFNVSPDDGDRLYLNFLDSINPVIPNSIGFHNSTLDLDTGDLIDNIWGDSRHLLPISATNEVITFRSIAPELWELSEISDHRAVLGRFEYPDLSGTRDTLRACTDETYIYTVGNDAGIDFQWQFNGQDLAGETNVELGVFHASAENEGRYTCQLNYSSTFGDQNNPLDFLFFPNGPMSWTDAVTIDFGYFKIDDSNCITGSNQIEQSNPTELTVVGDVATVVSREAFDLQIIDLSGKQLHSFSGGTGSTQINIIELPAGVYLARLLSEGKMRSFKFHKSANK